VFGVNYGFRHSFISLEQGSVKIQGWFAKYAVSDLKSRLHAFSSCPRLIMCVTTFLAARLSKIMTKFNRLLCLSSYD
jgi:hypothetical protein